MHDYEIKINTKRQLKNYIDIGDQRVNMDPGFIFGWSIQNLPQPMPYKALLYNNK